MVAHHFEGLDSELDMEFNDEPYHPIGHGDVSVSGDYESGDKSMVAGVVYRINDSARSYASYNVAKESLTQLGIQGRVKITDDHQPIVDMTYVPDSDQVDTRLSWNNDSTRVTGWLSFGSVRADKLKNHSEKLEIRHKISQDVRDS